MRFPLTYQPYGAHAILISWPSGIDNNVSVDIQMFESIIQKKYSHILIESVVAYSSLTLFLHKSTPTNNLISQLQNLYKEKRNRAENKHHIWKIPVCYDVQFGMDIKALATAKGYSISEVIKMHSTPLYDVHFIGFLPGFPYLGGLNTKLATPRLQVPRAIVPKGSVAIGGNQTGVYPSDSPGGWHVIGNTPISFFDVNKTTPCFLTAGDKLRFVSITKKKYHHIADLQEHDNYKIESEAYGD